MARVRDALVLVGQCAVVAIIIGGVILLASLDNIR
jgi:hypothetical protein